MRGIIVDQNAKFDAFQKEIQTLKLQLYANIESNKLLNTQMDALRKDFSEKQDKYIEEIVDLEKRKKALDNIVYKTGQTVQTMHICSALAKKHDAISVIDIEETLILAEESRIKMKDKQNDPIVKEKKVNIKPIDYALLNKLVNSSTNASGSKPRSNTRNNRISQPSSSNSENKKVEVHPRNVKSSLNKTNRVCNANVKHDVLNANSKFVCSTCNECLFDVNHDMCVVNYLNDVNVRVNVKSVNNVKKKEWKPTVIIEQLVKVREMSVFWSKNEEVQESLLNLTSIRRIILDRYAVVQIILWYLDSGCSKHMTRQRSQLINSFIKFMGTVRFRNDQVAAIMGYGDYQIGNEDLEEFLMNDDFDEVNGDFLELNDLLSEDEIDPFGAHSESEEEPEMGMSLDDFSDELENILESLIPKAAYNRTMLLAQVQEARIALSKEQLAILADIGDKVDSGTSAYSLTTNPIFESDGIDLYDSDCDEVRTAQACFMANLSSYGSDVLSEDKTNQETKSKSLTTKLERYKGRVKTFEQRLNADLSSREKLIDSQMDDMIRDRLALKQKIDSLKQTFSNQTKEKESLLQTFNVFKNESKEKESKYMDKEIDLEKKIKALDNIFYKVDLLNEFMEVKMVFNQMEVAVAQCSIDMKCFEIKEKELFLENDRVLECIICQDVVNNVMHADVKSDYVLPVQNTFLNDNIALDVLKMENDRLMELLVSQDLVHIAVNSLADIVDYKSIERNYIEEYERNLKLAAELSKMNELSKTCSILEQWSQLQAKNTTISNLKNHIQELKGKSVVDYSESVNKPKVISLVWYKLDLELVSSKLKNNREAHVDYIKITKANDDTLRDIVEQAKTSNPLDNSLAYACMYTKQIQELLVYVSDTCPGSTLKSEKLVVVTLMNTRKVTFAKISVASKNNTRTRVDLHKTQTTNKPLVPSTSVKSSTNASGSIPRSTTKNTRILQPSSSNQKYQRVESHTRNVKTSLN
ncbi:hypothetical protein Tco_0144517 [Tanacetum coccineum]